MIPILHTRKASRRKIESCRDYPGPVICQVPGGEGQDRRHQQGNKASVLVELTLQGVYKDPHPVIRMM